MIMDARIKAGWITPEDLVVEEEGEGGEGTEAAEGDAERV